MAVSGRSGGGSAYAFGGSGIPAGLNRIRTRRANVDHGDDDSDQFKESPSSGFSISGTHVRQKLEALSKRHGKLGRSKEGFCRGRTIAQWFGSSFLKGSHQTLGDFPAPDATALELNIPEKEDRSKKSYRMQKNSSADSPKVNTANKARKTLKSFSHELGLRAGHPSAYPKTRSYDNLKLLGSLRSRFDAAKEVVNIELGSFSFEVLEVLEKAGSLTPDEYQTAEDLYVLSRQCIDMTSVEFRAKCEAIVHELAVKRKTCKSELLKLFTRILFIVTRCTRLLHFEKDSEPMNERSLDKFRACLERIPSVDTNWIVNKGFADSDMGFESQQNGDVMQKLQGGNHLVFPSFEIDSSYKELADTEFLNTPFLIEQQRLENASTNRSSGKKNHVIRDIFKTESINRDKENSIDNFDLVICRICEESVPTMNLEQHSYICAFADKCASKNLDVNERLLRAAQLLEHFVELHNSSNHETFGYPESLRVPALNSALQAEGYSPKSSDWRGKAMDGMLDDLHEMDTACIEESHVSNLVTLKNHWLTKVNQYGSPSSNGSVTSTSSTCSPRAGNFDNGWSDLYLSELENMQQIHDLVDIAHCVVATDLSGEESHEFLLACMHDLQAVLQQSKHKALLVDTFGGRIESLLREKYILACNQVDRTDDIKHPESARSFLDSTSQSSSTSTPSHTAYKERTTIDDFEIIKPVSRGAYGKVFLARKRTTGDLFAIKVLKKLDMLRKNDIDRILAERNILITARNPFVVRFFYSFTSKENLYLVMEYLNGGDLYSLISKVGCLEEAIARAYIAELVLALEYLHSLGIVHRDLKPDNILIAHDGHIKLTDFGLSKIGLMSCTTELSIQEKKKDRFVDSHGLPNTEASESHLSAVGTPDYLAPEILLGTEHGYAADWWSVGIMLFELLSGIPPFNSDNPENIFDNILNRKIPWPSVPCEMSYEARDLIDRLLVHEPDHRLGAKGATEVKSHSFFSGVDWDNLTMQKAAFVPQPEGIDDTSYFVSRYNSIDMEIDEISLDSNSGSSEFQTNSRAEKMDEFGDLAQFDSSPLDLSSINFSFKNLSQLASINQDVLLQNGKESSKCSFPCNISNGT